MRKHKNGIFYITTIGALSVVIYWFIVLGSKLEAGRNVALPNSEKSQWQEFIASLQHNLHHPLALLLVQIVTIILVARLFGWICKKIGQPSVIGEMIAGIVLGPSFFPELSAVMFPPQSLNNLQFLSQIGLILFMFIVGMELDLKVLRNKANDAVVISHASIIFPFTLGIGAAYFIYQSFAPQDVRFASFALFIGIAMSITAFPVLARIVQERGIHKTRLGTIVITCAAADDITAWCILAAVIAIVKAGSFLSSLYVIALAIAYVLLMIKVVRPFLKRIGDLHSSKGTLSKPIVAIFFLTLILSSFATEVIGIHALFGAFMTGAIMPENVKFRDIFIEKVEDVALVLLLPLFFVFTGLRTEIGLLNDPYLWQITFMLILVAVVGKFVGSAAAAKFVGQSWKDSLTIGALMNTRGLMELVVLNIGYDLGVLSPEIFAMMVIMALVTTFMTGPSIDLINRMFKSREKQSESTDNNLPSRFKVLVSFANPQKGKLLLQLANAFSKKHSEDEPVTVMHLSPVNEMHHYDTEEYEKEHFDPVICESKELQQKIVTYFKVSNDISSDIVEVANKGNYDLLLVGIGQSIYEGSLLGKVLGFTTKIINPETIINQVTGKENVFDSLPFDERTKAIITKSKVPVGILINKEEQLQYNSIIIPLLSAKDISIIKFAERLIANCEVSITFINLAPTEKAVNLAIDAAINSLNQNGNTGNFHLLNDLEPEEDLSLQFNLMLISIEGWRNVVANKHKWLSGISSALIISDEH